MAVLLGAGCGGGDGSDGGTPDGDTMSDAGVRMDGSIDGGGGGDGGVDGGGVDGGGVDGGGDADSDGDGVDDGTDNCPTMPNAEQSDLDGDGLGDVCDSDRDGDGDDDDMDNCPGVANADQADTDGDGVGDVCDRDMDSDGDRFDDGVDNCPDIPNDQSDLDGDGIGDACDTDRDGDGEDDDTDNCPDIPNADQADADGDGVGDACDGGADTDGDGRDDDSDNCPSIANADQADADSDGIGDACDTDRDGDGDDDAMDNCPGVPNADQADADGDGVGDACDLDGDGDEDGIDDGRDNCPGVANPSQTDTDRDGVGDACDTDRDGDGVDNGVDNCPNAANADQTDTDGDGVGDACDRNRDTDGDGIDDGVDNCVNDANADQLDADSDGLGDVCDTDRDGDSIEDGADNCPSIPNRGQADADGDGVGDVCDAGCSASTDKSSWSAEESSWWLQPWGNNCDGRAANLINNAYAPLSNSWSACGGAGGLESPRDFYSPAYTVPNAGQWFEIDFGSTRTLRWLTLTQRPPGTLASSLTSPRKVTALLQEATLIFDGDPSRTMTVRFPAQPVASVDLGGTVDARRVRVVMDTFWGTYGNPTPFIQEADIVENPACSSARRLPDSDGDGVPDDWDAFPADPAEWSDFDGDGIGDNADPDDDNDGILDVDDPAPFENQGSADFDMDGTPDATDDDDDDDGVLDTMDAFPYDAAEWADADFDLVGDNADNCPGLANPDQSDLDGDGAGDLCDTDADGDGRSGADDCDDTRADTYVGAPEVWYDGIDQDCMGGSDYDQDGDGVDSSAHGGTDCNDTNPATTSCGSIGTLPASRAGWSLADGASTATRSWLDSPSNGLGTTGVSAIDPINATTLAPLSVFVVIVDGQGGVVPTFSAAERSALRTWVESGGSLMYFYGFSATDTLADVFGVGLSQLCRASGSATATGSAPTDITAGPYGAVTSVSWSSNCHEQISVGTSAAVPIFVGGSQVEAALIPPGALAAGSGPVLFFSDWNSSYSGWGPGSGLETLTKNAFAYALAHASP